MFFIDALFQIGRSSSRDTNAQRVVPMVSNTTATANRKRSSKTVRDLPVGSAMDAAGDGVNGGGATGGRPALAAGAQEDGGESTEDLLRRYRRRQTQALRDRLIERHRGLVETMSRTLASRLPPTVDAQDLEHAGMWGLMQAIATYEPERCDRFTAFMRIRVRGAMLDELRQMDYLPRLIRRRLRQHNEAVARLRMQLEREPTNDELAADLGISPAALVRWQDHQRVRAKSLADEGTDYVDQLVDEGNESPIEPIARRELLEAVRAALEPIEWKVLRLMYLEGLTGRQVASRLRLSASRICQIHSRVIDRLKTQLATLVAS
ncbi:MAG: sigma-70 family RNA polymerase sigma factor [bacterium]|nr:sigma-70 family RNA polymerase sigma factor [bacterium]